MADRPPPDVGLGDLMHLHRGLDPGLEALPLHRVLQGQRIDHRGEQAHVIGGGAGQPHVLGDLHAAHDIPPADHDRHVDPVVPDRLDFAGHQMQDLGIESHASAGGQRLAAQLEEHAPVVGARGAGHPSPSRNLAKRRTWMFSPVFAMTSLMSSPTDRLSSRMNGWSRRTTVL